MCVHLSGYSICYVTLFWGCVDAVVSRHVGSQTVLIAWLNLIVLSRSVAAPILFLVQLFNIS